MKIDKRLSERVRRLSELDLTRAQRKEIILKTSGLCNYFPRLALDCYLENPAPKRNSDQEYTCILDIINPDRTAKVIDYFLDSQSF